MTISPLEIVLICISGSATLVYIIYCIIKMVKTKKGKGKNENKGSNTKTD